MTYSQARQNFSSFLDRAKEDGEAMVTRSDGTEFKVIPVQKQKQSVSMKVLNLPMLSNVL